MKFATLIALVAVAQAQDEEAALEAGADCSAEGAACGEGLCCGTATAESGDKTVCNDAAAADFVDEAGDPEAAYTFACNEEGLATKMVASAAALLAVAYLQ